MKMGMGKGESFRDRSGGKSKEMRSYIIAEA